MRSLADIENRQRFEFLKTITQTKSKLDEYFGDPWPSIKMIVDVQGQLIKTKPSGCPTEVTTLKKIDKIHNIIFYNFLH